MIIDALIWHGIVKKLTSDEMFQNPTGENKTTSLEFMNYVLTKILNIFCSHICISFSWIKYLQYYGLIFTDNILQEESEIKRK